MRKLFYGIAAGLVSALVCSLLAYVVGIAIIMADTRELLPTLLSAVTMLPLLLLLILLLPTLVIGLLVGISLGVSAKATSRVYIVGAVAGVLFALVVLSGVLPLMIAHPSHDDFIAFISRPFRSGTYGLTLGLIASLIFRKLNAISSK